MTDENEQTDQIAADSSAPPAAATTAAAVTVTPEQSANAKSLLERIRQACATDAHWMIDELHQLLGHL